MRPELGDPRNLPWKASAWCGHLQTQFTRFVRGTSEKSHGLWRIRGRFRRGASSKPGKGSQVRMSPKSLNWSLN